MRSEGMRLLEKNKNKKTHFPGSSFSSGMLTYHPIVSVKCIHHLSHKHGIKEAIRSVSSLTKGNRKYEEVGRT